MKTTLYIMQGIPGSGKSTIAKNLAIYVYSTDEFHLIDGKYVFQPEKLAEYHQKNFERTKEMLSKGRSVVVDNTNIKAWECKKYVEFAVSLKIPVVFIRVNGNFTSIHDVPAERIAQMKENMENLTIESVLNSKYPWE